MKRIIGILVLCLCFQIGFCQTASEFFDSGKSKANLGNYYAAIKDFDKAIEIDKTFIKAYISRAAAREATSDFQGAIDDYSKAIELNSSYALAYHNRGLVKHTIFLTEEGCADLQKALELGYSRSAKVVEEKCK